MVIVHSRIALLPEKGRLMLQGLQPHRPPLDLTGEPADLVTAFLAQLAKGLPAKVEQVVLP
jgi:hypothetical protein